MVGELWARDCGLKLKSTKRKSRHHMFNKKRLTAVADNKDESLESLAAACEAAGAEVASLRARIAAEQSALTDLQARYTQACRSIAAGEPVDLQALRASIADQEALLLGLTATADEKQAPLAEMESRCALLLATARAADEQKRLAVLEEQALDEYRLWEQALKAAEVAFSRVMTIANVLQNEAVSPSNETAFRQTAGKLRGWFSGFAWSKPPAA
jgi:chromosome segregation ATPase